MRTLPRPVALVALVAALAVLALSPGASADPAAPAPTRAAQQEAATRFKTALELFKDGDYQAALIEFRRANELAPNYNVLYNIGQVCFQLQDYAGAFVSLERYLSEGGTNVSAGRRADVEKDLAKLRARLATVELTTATPDVELAIDDVVVGRSPLPKPVLVSSGRHKITASRPGSTPTTRVVEVASGDALQLSIDPVPPPAPPAAAPAGVVLPPPGPGSGGPVAGPSSATPAAPAAALPGPPPEPPRGGCAGCATSAARGGLHGAGAVALLVATWAGRRRRQRSPGMIR